MDDVTTVSLAVTARLVQRWTTCYTAGLDRRVADEKAAEIVSDLSEHLHSRRHDGFENDRIAREQLWRHVRGMPSDLAWRHDRLMSGYRGTPIVRGVVLIAAMVSSTLVVGFQFLFAAYVLGATSVADQTYLLGGMHYYGEEVGNPIFASVLVLIATAHLAACLARPVAPVVANVLAAVFASWWVMWFWLRVWPIALVVIAASIVDLALRASNAGRPTAAANPCDAAGM